MGEKYKSLIDRITYGLVKDHSIDSVDVEAYKFGLEVTILKALHYVSYVAIALCMKKILEAVIVFAVLYAFRRNTGGFHAKTRIGCYLFSCAVIFLSLFATDLNLNWWEMMIISIFDVIVLLGLSPVQNSNRNLDAEDMEYFRYRLRVLLLIYFIIYLATIALGAGYFIELYTIGLTMDTLLTIMGKLQSIKQS